MSERAKMAASALVAAALTAALFLTFGGGGTIRTGPSAPAGTPVSEAPQPAASTGSTEPDAAPASLDALWRDLPVVEGDGVITVNVKTRDGKPVPGVVVIAKPFFIGGGRAAGSVPPDRSIDETMRIRIAAAWRREGGRRRVVTGEDGIARLTRLGDVNYSVQAYSDAYTLMRSDRHGVSWMKPGSTAEYRATAVVRVRFDLENLDPDPKHHVSVVWAKTKKLLERGGGRTWTPDRPEIRLEPGVWWVQAQQGRPTLRKSEPVQITLEAGVSAGTVVLRLIEQPGLRGSVVSKDGLVLRNVSVWAIPHRGSEPPEVGRQHQNSALRARCDSDTGKYWFNEIRPGRWFVWVTLHGDRAMGSAFVEVADRMVEQEIEVAVPDRDRYVSLRVLGPDGKPLESRGLSITTSYKGPGASIGGGGETLLLEDGTWLVTHHEQTPAPDKATGGAYKIHVRHREYGALDRVYDPVTERVVEFRFGAAASLEVTMPGLEAGGLEGSVRLHMMQHMSRSGISLGSGKVATEDGFRFDEVQAGDWFLVLVCGHMQAARRRVTIREGENRIDWPLPTFHTVAVHPPEGVKTGTIEVTGLDPAGAWTHQFARAAKDGPTMLRWLPAGRYELSVTIDGKKRVVPLNVPAQTTVRLE